MAARTRQMSPSSSESGRDELVEWLKDAYAMERGLESSLEMQADNEDLSVTIRDRAAAHLVETRRHAQEVRSALQSLGSDTSLLKTGVGMFTQTAKGIGSAFARDERIKDLLDAYSMEHFEIACYTALAAAADREGFPALADTFRGIIFDEERMAEALILALPTEMISYMIEKTDV